MNIGWLKTDFRDFISRIKRNIKCIHGFNTSNETSLLWK
jgi:hypothetical protein